MAAQPPEGPTIAFVTIRPTGRALVIAALRYGLLLLPGLLLVYAGWSSGVVQPGLFGAPLTVLALFAFANTAASYVRVHDGTLTGRSLLGRIDVRVADIARVVPINLSYRRSLLFPWKRSARAFDVCTSTGPTGLWLSPKLYGQAPIRALLESIDIEPQTAIEDRILDPLSSNRDYRIRYSK